MLHAVGVCGVVLCLLPAASEASSKQPLYEVIENFVRFNPSDVNAYMSLAGALGNVQKTKKAAKATRKAIALNPLSSTAYRNMGYAQLLLNNTNASVRYYTHSLALEPTDTSVYTQIASAFTATRRSVDHTSKQAARYMHAHKKVVQVDPSEADGYINLGIAHHRDTSWRVGKQVLTKAARLDSQNPEAYFNLGTTLVSLTEPHEAASAFEQALALQPDHKDAQKGLSEVMEDIRDD